MSLTDWLLKSNVEPFFGLGRTTPTRRLLWNVVICSPKNYAKLQELQEKDGFKSLYKLVTTKRRYGQLRLLPDEHISDLKALLIDKQGKIHYFKIRA